MKHFTNQRVDTNSPAFRFFVVKGLQWVVYIATHEGTYEYEGDLCIH